MKTFIKPVIAVVIFILMQLVSSVLAVFIMFVVESSYRGMILDGQVMKASLVNPTVWGLALIISSILTALALKMIRTVEFKSAFDSSTVNWKWAWIAVFAAICGIASSNFLNEWFDLPNNVEDTFLAMSNNALGILAIAVVGPIVEELTYREAVIGNLVRNNINPWVAIIFSSLCFGIIHMNPAQIPFACIVGVIFGVIYVKTGNIVITTILHIINNSIAVAEMAILGDNAAEFSYKEALGSADIPAIIVLTIISVCLLSRFWKNYKVLES